MVTPGSYHHYCKKNLSLLSFSTTNNFTSNHSDWLCLHLNDLNMEKSPLAHFGSVASGRLLCYQPPSFTYSTVISTLTHALCGLFFLATAKKSNEAVKKWGVECERGKLRSRDKRKKGKKAYGKEPRMYTSLLLGQERERLARRRKKKQNRSIQKWARCVP